MSLNDCPPESRASEPADAPSYGEGFGTFWRRLLRGSRWNWVNARFLADLPADITARVWTLESRDRYHAKQGRSTARVVFHGPTGPLSVYLKRHDRLPWGARVAALVQPGGRHSPGAAEWAHLERARALGVAVPEVVAAGERIGPWGRLRSYLMVADLVGNLPLHEAIPDLAGRLDPRSFATWKRALIAEMARITATLHAAHLFHKDLYLCHFFLDPEGVDGVRLTLIDLHRLGHHPRWPDRWRWKDLAQLLYSTVGVRGIDARDCLRFWRLYRTAIGLARPEWHARMIALKAARYQAHNEKADLRPIQRPDSSSQGGHRPPI